MSNVYGPFALKLHAFGLEHVHDPNWTGMELYDRLKQHLRGRVEPVGLLYEPLEQGLPFWLGRWLFEDFISDAHFEDLDAEHQAWFVEDLRKMMRRHRVPGAKHAERAAAAISNRIDRRFEESIEKYEDFIESDGCREAIGEAFRDLTACLEPHREELCKLYGADFSDRVFHDRQLCEHLAQLMLAIGFDGDHWDTGEPQQWVKRVKWPAWVKTMIAARDRGACAHCQRNLTGELLAASHIDHIIALASGGCNDIVNLQLLCDRCNGRKRTRRWPVKSSVPNYIRRRRDGKMKRS
jgi:hypothetical protein